MEVRIKFNDDEEDRARIAINSYDAYCDLTLLLDGLYDRLTVKEDHVKAEWVMKDIREVLDKWCDIDGS